MFTKVKRQQMNQQGFNYISIFESFFCINHYCCANLKYDIDFEMSWVKDQGSCISNGVNKIMQ